jgi:Uma2 family endonuclease
MDSTARKIASYQDVLDAPEHFIAEVLDGELHLQPRPASAHAIVGTTLGNALGPSFQSRRGGGPGGWILCDEPELHLAADILVPDMAGWRRSRMPKVPNAPFFSLAPDWICEILSPSTRRRDRIWKLPIYARERVGHAWLLDPLDRMLEAYRLSDGRWLLLGTYHDDERVRVEPFEEIELELGALWEDIEMGDASDLSPR